MAERPARHLAPRTPVYRAVERVGLLCRAHIVHLALGVRPSDVPGRHAATPKATQTPDPAEEDLGRGWRDKAPRPRLRLARQALPGLGPRTGSHPHFQVVVVKPPIT